MTKSKFALAIMFLTAAAGLIAQTPAARPTAPATVRWQERRDPFVSPLREQTPGGDGPGCSVGKRCLSADEIVLKGIIATRDRGNIALVENPEHTKSNFLYVNDQIFHGSVIRITIDSLVIRETIKDEQGKTTTRDVVKRVVSSPVS